MHSQIDLVILGGGCAGLSLASRLSAFGKDAPSVLIIEQRENYTNDRTWCFWDIEHPAYKQQANHAWTSFEISNQQRTHQFDCRKHQYLMLESHTFYQDALTTIEQNPNVELLLGQQVISAPIKNENGWLIQTAQAQYAAKLIVDTRPPQKVNHQDAILWQSFVGYEIQTQTDCFLPEKMVLMDFDDTFDDGLAFIYILPTSEKKALIEYTVFSEKILDKQPLITRLNQSIAQKMDGLSYDILRTEHGTLPMGNQLANPNKESTYLYAGLFAGAARPSSGYAFQRIQSWATVCAQSIIDTNTLYAFPKERWLQSFMDELFLTVIHNNPAIAASLFEDLFSQCDFQTVVKFMSDKATVSEHLQIIKSLPPLPFIKALPTFLIKKICAKIALSS